MIVYTREHARKDKLYNIMNQRKQSLYQSKQRYSQSCIMSIFLHGAKFSKQILPQEKCVIRNNFGVFSELSLLKR